MAITPTSIQKESQDRYLTYAMSVVSGRALPDVRDGLKPVQRRILFAMGHQLHLTPENSHRKCAAVVGEVLARFHPHGDLACYEALVRMAQDFSLRYPLIDGQGNFGSLDGDSAAAYRYTEARLRAIAIEVLGEIDEDTVDFRDNFDATIAEPVVLPSRIPNLLINGASGIAVGMATSIPPHNLKDTIKALLELLDDPEISNAKLATAIKAPDFPTGCLILNSRKELSTMYETGKGALRMRGEWELEEGQRGKRYIVVSTIPYTVNKAQLVEKIADLIVQKKLPQLQDVRDESTDIVRVVLELSAGADPEVAMAYLFKHTPLETTFQVNMTALVPTGKGTTITPEVLSLKQFLQHFLDFRVLVCRRRLEFEKRNLLERIHILEGFAIIYDGLDEAIKIVRRSDGRADAAEKLRVRFKLSEVQSFAVVDMRIYQLSKTNIEDIRRELKEKLSRVREIDKLLADRKKISAMVRGELSEIAEKYGDKRRSRLMTEVTETEFNAADYVVQEDVYAIVTRDGWLKRIRQNNEIGQTRLREGDAILHAHPLTTLDSVAFLTSTGNLYALKVSDFASSSGYGDPIQKLLKFKDGETVVESYGVKATPLPGFHPEMLTAGSELLLASKDGTGFLMKIDNLEGIKRNGKRIMKLRDGDALAAVCHRQKHIALFTRNGLGLNIESKGLPQHDNAVVGVSLMGVRDGDELISAVSFGDKTSISLGLDSGGTKEIASSEVTRGHRGLKGTKVIARGELKRAWIQQKQQQSGQLDIW